MSRSVSIRNALPLAPIPESSPANFQQPPQSTHSSGNYPSSRRTSTMLTPSASTSPSSAMTTKQTPPSIGGMPYNFWWTPDHAVAAFSTCNGLYLKRQLVEPYPLPIVRTNLNHDVQKKAQSLVKQFPKLARGIQPFTNWLHLYKYFDAVDLWIEGAAFCFFVLNRIGAVNKQIHDEQSAMIEEFAKDWFASHENLVINNPQTRNMVDLFDAADMCNLNEMRDGEITYLKQRLDHYRRLLLDKVAEFRRRTAAQQPPPIIEHAPHGMMSPYHGIIYPPVPHGLPYGPPMIDPQRTPIPPQGEFYVQTVSVSHQTYQQFVESQRNLASRFDPRVPPSNIRNENNNHPMETRPRGWSNDTTRNGRGRAHGWFNGNSNHNNRRWVPGIPRSSPPRQLSSAEPIYVLTNQQPSPENQQVDGSQRIFSEPINPRDTFPQTSQRAFSDSPVGRGVFKGEPVATALGGRRASSNDIDAPESSNYPAENKVPYQDSQAIKSGNSTPHAAVSNDARVLEAIEKQETRSFPVDQSSDSRTAPTQSHNVHRNIELQVAGIGNGGPTHLYFYAGPPRRLSKAEQGTRTVYVGNIPYPLFYNHTLKEMLSECGAVDNVSYLVDSGHVFAAFMEESSVLLAVRKFDGYPIGSGRMAVNIPRNRSRADSYSSQRSFTSTGRPIYNTPRDNEYRPGSRRLSFRDSYDPHHVRNFSRHSVEDPQHVRNFKGPSTEASPTRIEGKLMSSVSEVIQHNAALNRMGPRIPLGIVEHHFGRSPQTKIPTSEYSGESFAQAGQNNKKENSPMKSNKPMTASRKNSFSSQTGCPGPKRGGKNKRPQPSRQNSSTSTQPTPAATPTKSRSEGMMSGSVQCAKPVADIKEVQKKEKFTSMTAEKDNALAHREQKENVVIEKPKSKNRKPPKNKKKHASKNEGESAMPSGSSNNTSFATEPSSDTYEVTSPIGTESSMSFRTSKSMSTTSFSTLPSRKPSVVSSVSTPPMSEIPEDDDNISVKTIPPKTPENDEKSTTPKPPQLPSKSPGIEVKPRSASGKNHSKKGSVVSTTSTTPSLRKTDAKSQSNPEIEEAKINLDDQKEFPALGPAKSPASAIADGKRPTAPAQIPPVIGALTERVVTGGNKNQVKPAVPVVAVPRSYMLRPQP